MQPLSRIENLARAENLFDGVWCLRAEPRGVYIRLDGRQWLIYHEVVSNWGWVAALTGSAGDPIFGSELWLPFVDGESAVPLIWWRHLLDGTRLLPARWKQTAPPRAQCDGSWTHAPALEKPLQDYDLVVVANRLPVQHDAGDGSGWKRSPGGLVSAVEPVMRQRRGAWVGWSGTAGGAADRFDIQGLHLASVPLSGDELDDYYHGFCNATLWPLYHDSIVDPIFDHDWWDAYVAVNERFAASAADCAATGATVWVHDYQLQLVPALLRRRRPDLRIGFFNHIPFPGREIFAQLPWRRQILTGILGADVVGFQRHTDVGNFVAACCQWTDRTSDGCARASYGIDDGAVNIAGGKYSRSTRVAAYPISIDFAAFDELAHRPDVHDRARRIRANLGNPSVVLLGVDRLDYTKGILHRLTAFEELLSDGLITPEQAVLVQVACPSRERVAQYAVVAREVEEVVSRINGDHSTMERIPVRYFHQDLPRDDIAVLYRAADIMLVTALRDGMNLVAKEFVASRPDQQGALVLSEFTGAADELTAAYVVNPHDIRAIKNAILQAISDSPAERNHRMHVMREQIRRHDVQHWATTFLDDLSSNPAAMNHHDCPASKTLATAATTTATPEIPYQREWTKRDSPSIKAN